MCFCDKNFRKKKSHLGVNKSFKSALEKIPAQTRNYRDKQRVLVLSKVPFFFASGIKQRENLQERSFKIWIVSCFVSTYANCFNDSSAYEGLAKDYSQSKFLGFSGQIRELRTVPYSSGRS